MKFVFDSANQRTLSNAEQGIKHGNALHRTFHAQRVNRVNLRKEFFFADLDEVQKIAERMTGKKVAYRADPRDLEGFAEEYRNSQATTLDDLEEIAKLTKQVEEEGE